MESAVAATMSCKISSKYKSLVMVLLTSESVDNWDARFSSLRYWREFSTAPEIWDAMDCKSRTWVLVYWWSLTVRTLMTPSTSPR